MDLHISDYLAGLVKESGVIFSAGKILDAKVIWKNTDAQCQKDMDDNKIIEEYAFVIKDTPCFSEIQFDAKISKNLLAERYGGDGVGVNGGGGRCGNSGKYQLKGIGANCMVGEHDDVIHNYGGLDAPLAIIEIIYTNLVNRLLPVGAVKIDALIYTGGKTAIYHHPDNLCWGGIMLREQCIRPAHFMRAVHFKPQNKYKGKLIGDISRIRNINRKLFSYFKDTNQFILFLGKFLQNCANQFGFARAVRIMHGTLTPSNITMDGKWLDLPITSMLNGGVNQCLTSCFYAEHQEPLKYAVELLHGYAKYNKVLLNPTPLVNYYNEQFDSYFRHYTGYVLGFDLNLIEVLDNKNWEVVATAFHDVIHGGKFLNDGPIKPRANDPVHALIIALFLSIKSSVLAEPYFSAAKIHKNKIVTLQDSFLDVMKSIWERSELHTKCNGKFESFVIRSVLIALKRAFLAHLFFSPNVSDAVWDLCQNQSLDKVGGFINAYDGISQWAYTAENNSITLCKTPSSEITYSASENFYVFYSFNKKMVFKSYFDLLNVSAKEIKCIGSISFNEYLERIGEIIIPLEKLLNSAS